MKTFYRSRHKFPTNCNEKGHLGKVNARRDIESELGRSLHKDTKLDKKGGNWRFREPNGGE